MCCLQPAAADHLTDHRRIVPGDREVHDTKVRYLLAGLFVVLELPVLLSFAAGAFVAGIFGAVVVLCSKAAQVEAGVFLRRVTPRQSSVAEMERCSHPYQSSAASGHAIMQEVTRQLAELPDDPAATVANVDFPLVLRGYHRDAVDEYVRRAAQLVGTVHARRSPEGAMRIFRCECAITRGSRFPRSSRP